jgi:hypothetical protein
LGPEYDTDSGSGRTDKKDKGDYVESAKVMTVADADTDVTYYDYDANFGVVMNENDLERVSMSLNVFASDRNKLECLIRLV